MVTSPKNEVCAKYNPIIDIMTITIPPITLSFNKRAIFLVM